MSKAITNTEKKKALAPKLRFKGFDNVWEKTTLFDISENVSYGMNAAATEFDGIHKYIRITDIDVNSGEFKPNPLTSPQGEIDEKFRLRNGDIVFARTGASVGKSYLYTSKDGALYYAGFLIKFSITKANPFFIYSLTLKEAYNKWVHIYSMRSGQPGLNAEEYKALKLHIPTLPEQQKIASFLSAIDEKIQQLTRTKELLGQYKKGVMQQLFPSAGSGQSEGKLRFKPENGKVYPKWEEKLYEDIFSFYTTNSFSRENLNYEGGEVKNIHYGDIHTKFSSQFEVGEEVVPYINTNVDLSKVKEENYCQEGDLVIADASEDYADIGKTIELVKLDKERVLAGLHTFLARPNKTKMYKGFSGYLVQSPYVRKQVMTIAQGTKVLSISPGRLGKVKLEIPCLEEQQKIASFLSGIDTKIESVAEQIKQTQIFKKGLLQQMFV